MYYDMHVHSKYSTDSTLDMELGVIKAIDMGLSGIAFTDHLDIDFTDFEDEFHYDFNDYFNSVNFLKNKYSNKINIISAVEIGMQPHVLNETYEYIKNFNFDYIIGSTHLIQKQDPYYPKFFDNKKDKLSVYNNYLKELYSNLLLFKDFKFNTMGHIDYIVRYAPYDDAIFYYKDYSDIIDEIFKHIINKNMSFEINTSTYIKKPLDINLLKRYKELGGYLITLGSDAHNESAIGQEFTKYANIIKECGFNYIYYFENATPLPIKL